MNIFQELKGILASFVEERYQTTVDTFTVEAPRDASHGDLSTNVAMVLAGALKQKPRDIAQVVADYLQTMDWVDQVSIAGPGFINLSIAAHRWHEVLLYISQNKEAFGNSTLGKGKKINVEYVSANPTGPMHIGHARGAVYGDALCALLQKAGYDVTKEYYINDAGSQIDTLAKSAYLRYLEALGEDIGEIPAGLYPGDYLKPVGALLAKKFGNSLKEQNEEQWLPIVKDIAIEQMIELIKHDLADLGIHHDVFVSERSLHQGGMIEKSLELLASNHLTYRGVLEPPKGKKPDDWEPREQLLFKSTEFGDDVDRPLQKSNGDYTYFAADIAYHYDKIQRGFNELVLVLGADHGGYVKRLSAVVLALSNKRVKATVKLAQLVNFMQGGQPIKMSKRKGSFTTVRDVIDEVGADIIRFIMLMRKNDMVLDFDLDLVKEQSKDNPVFYVQYAHARCQSVLRMAKQECPKSLDVADSLNSEDLSVLNDSAELELIKLLASWPRMVEASAYAFEPHRIAFFIYEVAAMFHALWNKGKDDAMLKFILPDDPKATSARLVLVQSTAYVIRSALHVLGVKPVDVLE